MQRAPGVKTPSYMKFGVLFQQDVQVGVKEFDPGDVPESQGFPVGTNSGTLQG